MRIKIIIIFMLLGVILFGLGYKIGFSSGYDVSPDANSVLMYGEDTGLPKNCRAIIKASIDGFKKGQYSCVDSMDSIDRNCGEFGWSRILD